MEEEYFEEYDEVPEEESAQFILDTGSACFLCLKDISSPGGSSEDGYPIKCEEGVTVEAQQLELLTICRYLDLNVSGIFTDVGPHFERNLSVNLCDGCSLVAGNLSDLCRELELLQMKVDHCLGTFSGILEQSLENSWRLEQHGYSAVKQIRMETKKKCLRKLKAVLPKVLLTRQDNYSLVDASSPEPVINFPEHPGHVNKIQTPSKIPNNYKQTSSLSINHHVMCYLCNTKFQRKGDYLRHQKLDCPFLPRGDTPNRSKPGPASRKPENRKNIERICTHCVPHRPLKVAEFRRHKVGQHIEIFFANSKLPHLTPEDFKLYCEHVFKVEMLSCGKITNVEGNPSRQCPHCQASYLDHHAMRYHLFSVHQQLLSGKIVALQKSSTVEDIKDMGELTGSEWLTCDLCGMKFSHKCSFMRHKDHTCKYGPRKPLASKYKRCGVCRKRFWNEGKLLEHQRREHGEEQFVGQVEDGSVENWEMEIPVVQMYNENDEDEDASNEAFDQELLTSPGNYEDDQVNNVGMMITPD